MKTIISIILLIPLLSYGQAKGDNTIKITSSSIKIEDIQKAFIEAGYPVDQKLTNSISTGAVSKKSNYAAKFSASIVDGIIIIKGWFKPSLTVSISGVKTEADFEIITKRGSKGSVYDNSFKEMQAIALSISPNIQYSTQ